VALRIFFADDLLLFFLAFGFEGMALLIPESGMARVVA
jgi:hypothetical protein